MKNLLTFIILGLLTTVPGEILNQVLSRQKPRAFASTMVSYTVLLFLGFFVGRLIGKLAGRKSRAAVVQYLLFGSLGLSVEWFLLGNAPVLDPLQLVVQPGMFSFWGTMLLAPWLLQESTPFGPLQKSFRKYFAGFSALYLAVALLIPRDKGGIYFGFIIFAVGYTGLNTYYWRYYRQLREAETSRLAQAVD